MLTRSTQATIAFLVCLSVPACGGSKLSRSNYDRITNGMTQADVEAILGPGQEDASASVDVPDIKVDVPNVPGMPQGSVQVKGLSQSAKAMKWQDGGKIITVGFLNGKVVSKAQAGL